MTKLHRISLTPHLKKLLLIGLLLAGLLGILYQTALAQPKSFVWDRYDVVITLQPNGELHVEETQTLNFVGEPFTFGYATIPTGSAGNNDGIRNLTIREGDLLYTQASGGRPGTYTVTNSSDEVRIDWYFEPALGQRTYTFSYVVDGGVIVGTSEQGDGDQIFWKAIPADHPAYVNNSTVTIILPEGIAPQQYTGTADYLVAGYADGDDSIVATSVSEDGRIITYQLTRPLPPDEMFEVRVQFPHGLLDIPVPDWQSKMERADTFNLFGYALSLLCLIAGPLLVVAVWYGRGRDPETGLIVPQYITHPPGSLRPAVVGTLTDEKADMRDIVSIIVDLAQRGYMTIEETGKSDHKFTLIDKDRSELRPFESQLIKDVFGKGNTKNLKSLTNKFYTKVPSIRKMLYEELVTEGLTDVSPDRVRSSYTAVAVLFSIIAGMVFFCGGVYTTPELYAAFAFCPAIALAGTAVALFIAARHMPRKTSKGSEETIKWLAFKTYLQNIEQYEDMALAGDIFEKYLPYATAFGLDRSWITKFSRQPNVPVPTWYMPMHPTTSKHGSRGSTSGGSMPSLDTMADGMAGGLESMSSGLTRMLNSAATTLNSRPASSSSSGGSSGGFSGGSSFSSSGGGSRGFG